VRLIAIDSNTCNIADTAFLTLRVRDNKADLGFTYSKLLPCTSLNYQFTNTSVAPPALPFGPKSFEWNFGDGVIDSTNFNPQHSFPAPGSYLISLTLKDTNYCNAPEVLDSLVFISDNVKARFNTPSIGCAPYDAIFENTSFGGQTFEWSFGDGSNSNDVNPVHHYADTGTYVIRLVAIDSFTCNITDTFYFSLKVVPKPTANFSYLPTVPQENTAIRFINNSLNATYYKWDFGDGDTLITRKKDTLLEYTYLRTGIYRVCLSAYNNQGCVDDTCMEVQTIIVPDVDVPNAFTPNGDGINDFVRVRGFGIVKMNWQIYNRWGVKVFESSSVNNGWDGKYKGTLQPQEVYNYVLSVEFSDGTKYQKKGDITLLR
jgi:gliding motility-associated-like protein